MTTKDDSTKAPETGAEKTPETGAQKAPPAGEKSAETAAEKAPDNQERPRKIVRSGSTAARARPAGGEGGAEGEAGAPSGGGEGAGAGGASPEGGGEGAAAKGEARPRPAGRPVLDMRAPRPATPGARPAGGPRPGGPRPAPRGRPEGSRDDLLGPRRPVGGLGAEGRPIGERRPSGGPGGRPRSEGGPPGVRRPRPEGAPPGPRPPRAEGGEERSGAPRPPRAEGAARPMGPGGGPRPRPEGGPPGERRPRPDGGAPPGRRSPEGRPEGAPGARPSGEGQRPSGAARPSGQGQAAKPAGAEAKPQGGQADAKGGKAAGPAERQASKPVIVPVHVPLAKTAAVAKKPALTPKEALSAKARAAQATKGGKAEAPKAEAPKTEAPAPADASGQAAEATSSVFDEGALAATWEGAKETLKRVGDKALSLVDAWLGGSNAAAIAATAEADDAPGPVRKAARRALNVLKARGIAIPSKPHVARVEAKADVLEAAFIPPDATGTTSITITSRDSSGRYHIAEVIARDPVGILHAGSGWLSGSQLKEGRSRAAESMGVAPVSVPVEWARHRIAESRKLNATSKQVLPLGLERCRELIEPVPEEAPKHPTDDLDAEVTSELAWARAPGSSALHDEPEFRGWLPDRKVLEEVLQGVGKRLGSDGLKDSGRVSAALDEEIQMATDRFFSPEVRTLISTRMRDAAISVRARKGDAKATEVLAVARAVREAGLITSPPREIPFLVGFLQKGIGALAQQGGGSLRIPVGGGLPSMPSTPEGGGGESAGSSGETTQESGGA